MTTGQHIRPARPLCLVAGCTKMHRAKGYCTKHYDNFRRHGDPLYVRPQPTRICSISECKGRKFAREWCRKHYDRWERYGDPLTEPPERIKDEERACSLCAEVKPKEAFRVAERVTRTGQRRKYFEGVCKDCQYVQNLEWTYANTERRNVYAERQRAAKFVRLYGPDALPLHEARENGARCENCGHVPEEGSRSLHIDHDHITGRVRGLLCHHCNTALGALQENRARIQGLVAYLDKYEVEAIAEVTEVTRGR